MPRNILFTLLLAVASCLAGWPVGAGEKSSAIQVEKGKGLTFDPRTCTSGQALVYWSFGSTSVKVLGHKDGQCVFELTTEVEGGYKVYLCKVPVDGGPVKIEVGVKPKTSFPLDKCKVIRGGNVISRSKWVPIEGTEDLVYLRDVAAGKGEAPRAGDKLRVKLQFFPDHEFKEPRPGTKPQEIDLVLGDKPVLPWLAAVVTDLPPGGKRQAWLDGKAAVGAKELVPNFDPQERLYFEVEVLSVGGKQ
jgi:hypothetical protein